MDRLKHLQNLINEGYIEQALKEINQMMPDEAIDKDALFYLRGNIFRKQGNWQQALNNYQAAIDINPNSPAVEARKMIIDILNFYHKDMFNQ